MIRITLIEIASFLLPFLLFFIWRWQTQSEVKLTATPALKLGLAGALLAILVMILLVVLESVRGGHEGDQYVPPRLENGRVVPGHFVSEPETETGDAPEDDEPQ
ncbi:MAG: DUF6111 family protein [Alphaproteobacteria bacterium]|jgi:hypothetical protein|uniref:DUF6111 family protein n=1 Tax=Maricaulis alexandrii TaxID=2570354 RepID=UPI001108FAF4|nr:DUF6111 family protein [Maricaulis alexandrii]MCR9266399.1 DUF6111 family protein [Alphaproteobacteria bacterium]